MIVLESRKIFQNFQIIFKIFRTLFLEAFSKILFDISNKLISRNQLKFI